MRGRLNNGSQRCQILILRNCKCHLLWKKGVIKPRIWGWEHPGLWALNAIPESLTGRGRGGWTWTEQQPMWRGAAVWPQASESRLHCQSSWSNFSPGAPRESMTSHSKTVREGWFFRVLFFFFKSFIYLLTYLLAPLWGIWDLSSLQFSSVQSLSHVRFFATPWTAACQASLSVTNSRSLLKLMYIESVIPSNHLILCHPLRLLPSIFPSIRVFSNESVLCIRWPKYWSFSFSISLSNDQMHAPCIGRQS